MLSAAIVYRIRVESYSLEALFTKSSSSEETLEKTAIDVFFGKLLYNQRLSLILEIKNDFPSWHKPNILTEGTLNG
ncbi:hypothetical protein TCA2_0621 [Paenibacillus sp. TCA20]|nr:hypothetical protein TCA2_0621 [Paenibacillus sp. TCA20]